MEFFIIKNEQQQGPFTATQLANMNLLPDTPVWHEGLDDWTTADAVPELKHIVAYAPRPEGYTQAAPPAGPQQPPQWQGTTRAPQQPATQPQPSYASPEPTATAAAPRQRKSRTGLWITLGIVAVLLIILAVTNPSKEDHCRAVTGVSQEWTHEKITELGGSGIIGDLLKIGTSQGLRYVINNMVDVDNYVLCSVGYIDMGSSKSRVSFGILGHVFTFNKDQINQKIKDAIGIDNFSIFADDNDAPDNADTDALAEAQPLPDEPAAAGDDNITAEDRSEGVFNTPAQVDTLLKAAAKGALKEGSKIAEKAIEDAIDGIFD